MQYDVRDLALTDIPLLIEWLEKFSDSFEYPGKAPIDPESVAGFVSGFIDSERQAAMIAEHNGEPVAVLGFSMVRHPWTGQAVFYKAFWFSKRAGAGRELMRSAKHMCKRAGVSQMIASSMTPETNRILEREGFKPLEMNYILEL